MGILSNLRQKPDNQKNFFSLVTAVILTLVIVIVWASFTKQSFSTEMSIDSGKLSSISPIQMIKDEFSKAVSGLNDNLAELDNLVAEDEFATSTVTDSVTDFLLASSTDDGIATTANSVELDAQLTN